MGPGLDGRAGGILRHEFLFLFARFYVLGSSGGVLCKCFVCHLFFFLFPSSSISFLSCVKTWTFFLAVCIPALGSVLLIVDSASATADVGAVMSGSIKLRFLAEDSSGVEILPIVRIWK